LKSERGRGEAEINQEKEQRSRESRIRTKQKKHAWVSEAAGEEGGGSRLGKGHPERKSVPVKKGGGESLSENQREEEIDHRKGTARRDPGGARKMISHKRGRPGGEVLGGLRGGKNRPGRQSRTSSETQKLKLQLSKLEKKKITRGKLKGKINQSDRSKRAKLTIQPPPPPEKKGGRENTSITKEKNIDHLGGERHVNKKKYRSGRPGGKGGKPAEDGR